ncbi:MAG: alpha/beta hydrolase [Methylocella sp.]
MVAGKSGSFDTLTSLAGAKAAAVRLSNATIISIPGIGHFVSPNSLCAQRVIVSFLADPAALDASCVTGLAHLCRATSMIEGGKWPIR